MKHSIFNKQLMALLIILLSNFSMVVVAREYDTANSQPCCVLNDSRSFDCGCFTLQVHAGIAPIIWTRRGNFELVSCNIAVNACAEPRLGAINNVFSLPKFNKLYKLPWTVGGKIGYMLDECSEIYIEGNYRQAKAKNFEIAPQINNGSQIVSTIFRFNNLSKYSFFDVYVGVRRYFEICWCDTIISPFIGLQLGVAHHKGITSDINFVSTSNTCGAPVNALGAGVFGKHTAVAIGGNLGFDYCLGCGFSLVLTAEFIATCGPNGNPNLVIQPNVVPDLSPTNFMIGGIGTEILFPITLGLKYNF